MEPEETLPATVEAPHLILEEKKVSADETSRQPNGGGTVEKVKGKGIHIPRPLLSHLPTPQTGPPPPPQMELFSATPTEQKPLPPVPAVQGEKESTALVPPITPEEKKGAPPVPRSVIVVAPLTPAPAGPVEKVKAPGPTGAGEKEAGTQAMKSTGDGKPASAGSKRKALLSEVEEPQPTTSLSVPQRKIEPVTYLAKMPTRPVKAKPGGKAMSFFLLIALCNLLVVGGAGVWLYSLLISEMDARLTATTSSQPQAPTNYAQLAPVAPPKPAPAPVTATVPAGVTAEQLAKAEQRWTARVAYLDAEAAKAGQQHAATLERLDATQQQLSQAQKQLADVQRQFAELSQSQKEAVENGKILAGQILIETKEKLAGDQQDLSKSLQQSAESLKASADTQKLVSENQLMLNQTQKQFADLQAGLAGTQKAVTDLQGEVTTSTERMAEWQTQTKALSAQVVEWATKKPEPTATPTPALTLEQWKEADGKLQGALADQKKVVEDLQKRLADSESQLKKNQVQLKDMVIATSAAAAEQKPPVTVMAATIPGGVNVPNDLTKTPLTPTESELMLLKERNRLTRYADEAIATASRVSLDHLMEARKDPRLVNLNFAVEAEILRVRNFYLSGSRLTKYEIPVADVFPASATLRDVQLSDEQVIQLLGDAKQPWQTRMKAAWILGHRKSPHVGDALIKALKEDPNLDVAKEATYSFEQMTGFVTRLFDPALLEVWWKESAKSKPADKSEPVKKG